KSIVRTAVGLVVAGGLALADRQRAAVGAWSLEHPERDRIDMGDRQGARVVDRGSKLRCRLQAAEEVRLLEDHARRLAGRCAQLAVWYSKIACSTPWLISGW